MRVHMISRRMTLEQADLLEYYLRNLTYITDVKVNDRTGDAVICDRSEGGRRDDLIDALSRFNYDDARAAQLVPDHTGRQLNRQYEEKLVLMTVGYGFRSIFFPSPLRSFWAVIRSIRFLSEGLRSIARGKLSVSVLDACAITASMAALRNPPASSARTPWMVLPPGLHTASFSAPGCSPVSSASAAVPSSICAA